MQKIIGLDGLRAVSILLIIFHHLHIELFQSAAFAVDIFFVISGFLITRGLVIDKYPSLLNFYVRRLARIQPGLILMLGTLLGMIALGFFETNFDRTFQSSLQAIFATMYIRHFFWREPLLEHLGPLWTLNTEELFYLVWPLIFYPFYKYKGHLRSLTIGLIAFVLTIAIYRFYVMNFSSTRVSLMFFFSVSRLDSIGVGCLLGLVYDQATFKGLKNKILENEKWITASFLGLLFLSIVPYGINLLFNGAYIIGALLTACLIVIIINARQSTLFRILSLPFMEWTGKISFGLYIYHQPIISILRQNNYPEKSLPFLTMILTYTFAHLSFEIIEKKFIALSKGDSISKPISHPKALKFMLVTSLLFLIALHPNTKPTIDQWTTFTAIPKDFNWKTYLELNPDLPRENIDTYDEAKLHYIQNGRREGRKYK